MSRLSFFLCKIFLILLCIQGCGSQGEDPYKKGFNAGEQAERKKNEEKVRDSRLKESRTQEQYQEKNKHLESLKNVHNILEENHQICNDKLEVLSKDNKKLESDLHYCNYNRGCIYSEDFKSGGGRYCLAFLNKGIYHLEEERRIDSLKNYSDLALYFKGNGNYFTKCYNNINYILDDYKYFSSFDCHLKLKSYVTDGPQNFRLKVDNSRSILKYCEEKKLSNCSQDLSESLLYPEKIRYFSLLLLEILPFEQLVDEDKKLYSQEQLSKDDFKPLHQLQDSFNVALEIIEIAIKQEETLIGKGGLAESILSSFVHPVDREKIMLYGVLKDNPILTLNVFLRDLKRLTQSEEWPDNFEEIDFSPSQSEKLKKALPDWDFVFQNDASFQVFYNTKFTREKESEEYKNFPLNVHFQDGKIQVSTSKDDMSEDEFIYSDEIKLLFKLKAKLKDEQNKKIQYFKKFVKKDE